MEDLALDGAVTVEAEEEEELVDELYEDDLREAEREERVDEEADEGWEYETAECCCTGGANASIMERVVSP